MACENIIEANCFLTIFQSLLNFSKCIKANGEIVGGISACTYWNMAVVEALWIKEEFRNNGYATALLTAFESHAKECGSTIIYLETFNPQMRNLCEKLGYVVYGIMDDYPEGYSRYYMCKKLTDGANFCCTK